MEPAPARAALPPALVALLAVGSAGCSSLDQHVHNLLELHQVDGTARFYADLKSPLEWAMSQQAGAIRLQFADGDEGAADRVDDPYEECLAILLELAEADADAPRAAGLQVEVFAWLAVDDVYALSRERCLIELAHHARRLELEDVAPEPAAPAGPEELERALGRVQDQAFFALRPSAAAASAAFDPEELRAACDAVAALPLDREGGRRALAFLNILLSLHARGPSVEERLLAQPIYALHLALQRRFVAQSLRAALGDPVPFVRAAALDAVLPLPGVDRAALLDEALSSGDRRIVLAGLGAIERHGLPRDAERPELERGWTERLIELAQSLDGRVSAAACQALEAVSESGLSSLRAEDWRRWWRLRPDA